MTGDYAPCMPPLVFDAVYKSERVALSYNGAPLRNELPHALTVEWG